MPLCYFSLPRSQKFPHSPVAMFSYIFTIYNFWSFLLMTMNCHIIVFFSNFGVFFGSTWQLWVESKAKIWRRRTTTTRTWGFRIDFFQPTTTTTKDSTHPIKESEKGRFRKQQFVWNTRLENGSTQVSHVVACNAMGPIYATNPKACCTQVKSYLGCLLYLVLFRMLSFFLPIAHTWLSNTNYILQQKKGHSEPASTSAPSTGCLLLLSCGWTSSELIFGFTLVTNSVGNRSHL